MSTLRSGFIHSRQFTESVLKGMQEGLLLLDETNRIITANEAALNLFGVSQLDDVCGRHFVELCIDEDGADNFIATLESQGNLKNFENSFIKADGQSFTGLYSGAIIHNWETSERAKVIFIQDITEREKSSEKLVEYAILLEKNNKELNQFAYIVSDDLKETLRAIHNLSLWLKEDLGQTLLDDIKSNLDKLRSRVQRLESPH